jgi:hypothetical protein
MPTTSGQVLAATRDEETVRRSVRKAQVSGPARRRTVVRTLGDLAPAGDVDVHSQPLFAV